MSGLLSFEEIKKYHLALDRDLPGDVDPLSRTALEFARAHVDRHQLLRMVEALADLKLPPDAKKGKAPLCLYFASVEEREGFIQALQAVAPMQPTVKLPIVEGQR